jgi:hypothetical protein
MVILNSRVPLKFQVCLILITNVLLLSCGDSGSGDGEGFSSKIKGEWQREDCLEKEDVTGSPSFSTSFFAFIDTNVFQFLETYYNDDNCISGKEQSVITAEGTYTISSLLDDETGQNIIFSFNSLAVIAKSEEEAERLNDTSYCQQEWTIDEKTDLLGKTCSFSERELAFPQKGQTVPDIIDLRNDVLWLGSKKQRYMVGNPTAFETESHNRFNKS